jgi:hypothetical protein
MNIREKLTFQFVGIVAVLFIFSSIAIYYFSSTYRKEDFYRRLREKSLVTTKLFLEVNEMNASVLARIENDNPIKVTKEKIKIFNSWNELLYSSDKENFLKVNGSLIDKVRLKENIRFNQDDHEVLAYTYKDKLGDFVVFIGGVTR